MKIVPYYDRSVLIEETTQTVERNMGRGMLLVLLVLGIFLFNVRTAIIVAITIPFALMFSFICLDWRHIPANLLSIGAIHFGILVDGAVVMVENIFRELAERHDQDYNLISVIRNAAKDVERPIFYAVAVIIAGYLPIYVLQGPSGRLFQPMADTMSFALVGSVIWLWSCCRCCVRICFGARFMSRKYRFSIRSAAFMAQCSVGASGTAGRR